MIAAAPSKSRIVGGILVGAALAGVAAWAVQNAFRQEFQPQQSSTTLEREDEQSLDTETTADVDGIFFTKTDSYEVAGITDPGKRRANNQDHFRMGRLTLAGEQYALAVVCDGMGGHAGGEVASQIASDVIWTVLSKQSGGDTQALHQTMTEALERADAAIDQRASKDRDLEGMGTTAVLAAINRDQYVHCYLGDSRLYHLSGDNFVYQTKDHSVVRFLVEEGIIGPEEAKDHPYRSQLTSSLGGGPNANRLTIEPKWDSKDTPLREWSSGDWLVLCSDGLNSELEDEQIAGILKESENARDAALKLREEVLETEARDNVTVVVARKY